jgi:flagellar hook-associated protein 1 FlgK
VSLDEEAMNLMEYQRAYQAAARLVTTIDEMLKVLLEM